MFDLFDFLPFFGKTIQGFSFGGGKKTSASGSVNVKPLMPSWQMGLGQDLSSWVQKFLQLYNPGEPYGGQFPSTSPTSFEETGLNQLGSFLSTPATGDLYGAAKGQVLDTLGGRYADPAQSPFIQAATKLASQNLQDAIRTTRGQRGARGTYFTRAGLEDERLLGERTHNYMNTLIGDYINQERGRQLQAAPLAQELEQYGEITAPLSKITASQTLGALPRLLEEADFERRYADFQRQRTELSGVPGVGTSVFGRNIPTIVSSQAPAQSGFESLSNNLGPWIDIALKVLPIIMASGCWVAAEVFNGWEDPRTTQARYFVHFIGPKWFRNFYMKHGEKIAGYIKDKPILKRLIKPIFSIFAYLGRTYG